MEKACKNFTVKTSPIPRFNFGKYPKTADTFKRLLEISYFKRDHEIGNFIFFLCTQSLFMNKIMKNRKGLKLVTCLFELQHMFTKINFLAWSFESGNWKEKGKKAKH